MWFRVTGCVEYTRADGVMAEYEVVRQQWAGCAEEAAAWVEQRVTLTLGMMGATGGWYWLEGPVAVALPVDAGAGRFVAADAGPHAASVQL